MTDQSAADSVLEPMLGMDADILANLNTEYGDSILLIARALGGHADATSARVLAIDSLGVDYAVTGPAGDDTGRVLFPQPIKDSLLVTSELFAMVVAARAASGEDGQTRAELVMDQLGGITTFITSVVAVTEVQPHLRKVTFGGGDLTSFQPLGPDTFLYVLLPPPGRTELTIDQGFTWESVSEMAEEDRPVGGYYTLRHLRPSVSEMDVLMVLHGDSGHASAWAARAKVGDPVALWGPRTAWTPPADTDRYLLVADETGLPAVSVIIESLPVGTEITVVAESISEDERQELPSQDGVIVVWCDRNGEEPGTTSLLEDAVRALPWSEEGSLYVWGGGESHSMTAVRKYVRQERGLAREAVDLVPYWRHPNTTEPDDED
ncbi:hypothetical protein BH10ACT3_BH10ACT3_04860 [soil metagenome]